MSMLVNGYDVFKSVLSSFDHDGQLALGNDILFSARYTELTSTKKDRTSVCGCCYWLFPSSYSYWFTDKLIFTCYISYLFNIPDKYSDVFPDACKKIHQINWMYTLISDNFRWGKSSKIFFLFIHSMVWIYWRLGHFHNTRERRKEKISGSIPGFHWQNGDVY